MVFQVSGRAGLFFTYPTPPLVSFKYQDQSPGSLWTGSSVFQILLAKVRTRQKGAGHQRGGELPDYWFIPETGFPNRTSAVPPTPILQGLLRGWKQSIPGWPCQCRWRGSILPHQCLPAPVDSEPGSGNQSDHFAHFPSLPGRLAARSQGGVNPARSQPPLLQRLMDLPRRLPSKGHTRSHSGGFQVAPLPVFPHRENFTWLKTPLPGLIAVHLLGQSLARTIQAKSRRAASRHAPGTLFRTRLPWGRLQSGRDTELSPRIECQPFRKWLLRGITVLPPCDRGRRGRTADLEGTAGGKGQSSPTEVGGWTCGTEVVPAQIFQRLHRQFTRMPPRKQLRPHVQPPGPVDGNPLEGRAPAAPVPAATWRRRWRAPADPQTEAGMVGGGRCGA